MICPPATDFWQVGLVRAPMRAFLGSSVSTINKATIVWMPNPGPWRYLADPFGIQRGNATHVFVESFDYRTKHALIEHHEFDHKLNWQKKDIALTGPFHLSYPYLIEDGDEVFMVPESNQANEITLYRALNFPGDWVRETTLLAAVRGAEPSLIQFEGCWWMFFTIVGDNARDQRELHIAYAPALTGPWRLHRQNPIISDRRGARPGGTPFVGPDGKLILPVQDCSKTYGGGIRFLRFKLLTPHQTIHEYLDVSISGDSFSATHHDGCHTLASCGDLTLIDTKCTVRTWSRYSVDLKRRVLRLGNSLGIVGQESTPVA